MVTIDIAEASALQTAIQKKLCDYGYSTEDDPVMAEYVTVMLANNKSSEQITAELSDLIGSDYDSSFTGWIFDSAIPQYYKGAGVGPTPTSAVPTTAPISSSAVEPEREREREREREQQEPQQQVAPSTGSSNIETVGDSREFARGRGGALGGPRFGERGLPARPPNGPAGNGMGGRPGVFGNAMAGVKREADPRDRDGPSRRPRMSEGYNGNEMAMDEDGPPGAKIQPQRSIFDRAGVRAGTALPGSGPGVRPFSPAGGFVPNPQVTPFGGVPQIPGLPPLHIPDNFNQLPPAQQQAIQQQIFQHQLIAAAAANQLYAPPPQLQQGGPGPMPFPGGPPPPHHLQHQHPHAPPPPHQQQQQQAFRKPSKPVKLPPRPTSEELCKYGVECKNAICRYSHPSPAATKESGLVLTKEPCEKQVDCEDKDCPKSHVSNAQKTDPQGLNVSQYLNKSEPAAPAPAVYQHVPAANPGAKPCMFGAACTRPGCFFSHPTSASPFPSSTSSSSTSSIPCKFGLACTRADCHFSHPPGHRAGGGSRSSYPHFTNHNGGGGGAAGNRNMSATFGAAASAGSPTTAAGAAATNGSGNGSAADTIVGSEKMDESKMSARMKKFGAGASDDSASQTERIVGGKHVGNQEGQNGNGGGGSSAMTDGGDDVEIVM